MFYKHTILVTIAASSKWKNFLTTVPDYFLYMDSLFKSLCLVMLSDMFLLYAAQTQTKFLSKLSGNCCTLCMLKEFHGG